MLAAPALAGAAEVELTGYGGYTFPFYSQTFKYDPGPVSVPIPGVTVEQGGSFELKASGGPAFAGGIAFYVTDGFGFEIRYDHADITVETKSSAYTVRAGLPAPLDPVLANLTLSEGTADLKAAAPLSLNLKLRTGGSVKLFASGGASRLGDLEFAIEQTIGLGVIAFNLEENNIQVGASAGLPPWPSATATRRWSAPWRSRRAPSGTCRTCSTRRGRSSWRRRSPPPPPGRGVFLCNSGAEANEAMLKLARKFHADQGHPERNEIVACQGSFHGRTMFALAATGQPKYHHGFEPLVPGVRLVPYGDAEALAAALGPRTAAFVVEPIQGEAGVVPPPEGYLARARALTREAGALLLLDEVQTGLGRTGLREALRRPAAGGVPTPSRRHPPAARKSPGIRKGTVFRRDHPR